MATATKGVTEALLDIDTDALMTKVNELKAEADDVSYKHSALLVELQATDAYHADMEQQLNARLAFHREQREKLAKTLGTLGATSENANGIVAHAAATLPSANGVHDDEEEVPLPASPRKARPAKDGTIKTGTEELMKANVNGLTQDACVELFLKSKSDGGLEYETKSDKETFSKSVYNSGIRPLTNDGVLIQMPSGSRNKLYVHRDNYDAYMEWLSGGSKKAG